MVSLWQTDAVKAGVDNFYTIIHADEIMPKVLTPDLLEKLVQVVTSQPRYATILPALVGRVAQEELDKGRGFKEAVKTTRARLHQAGGAYQAERPDYRRLTAELHDLPRDIHNPQVQDFCRAALAAHASTRERLPILERFFQETLAAVAPVHSVLDLACGMNPLALPWLPLAQDATYHACDIYADLTGFLQNFITHVGMPGRIELCDLTANLPAVRVQAAFILKTLPCLDHLDKTASRRLLEGIDAEVILVSYPLRSLGGRGKGRLRHYSAHFEGLIEGKGWRVQHFEFASELAFLLRK